MIDDTTTTKGRKFSTSTSMIDDTTAKLIPIFHVYLKDTCTITFYQLNKMIHNLLLHESLH